MSNLQMLVLADDLTGAIEVGAKFAGQGIGSLVTTELSLDATGIHEAIQVLVIDTESRHLPPSDAARRVYDLSRAGSRQGIRCFYKKTDSTLRGNIGSELEALLSAHPGSRLVYVPAYPQMGRTVKGGVLYVNGRPVSETAFAADRLNPAVESHIPTMLASQCSLPAFSASVENLETAAAPGIYICDSETDVDLSAVARVFMKSPLPRLAAGPAGFAQSIAKLVEWPRTERAPWPGVRNCLIVNGSLHGVSLQQVSRAEASGFRSVEPRAAPQAVAEFHWAILRYSSGATAPGLRFATLLGEIVRDVSRQVQLDALVIFGGDTASGVLGALGHPPVYPMGEVFSGVPLSRIDAKMLRSSIGERERDLCLVTKAGAFGPADILLAIRERLTRGRLE